MFTVSQKKLEEIIAAAIKALPQVYQDHIENIAFIVEDFPTEEQRQKLKLRHDQTLLGLYEGVPLPERQGAGRLYPDKITFFKGPLFAASSNLAELRERVSRTVWHELAHYYGLDHKRIAELESKEKPKKYQ